MNEIDYFMEKSEVEHRLRMTEHVVSLEEYWHYRLGTSAVRVVLSVIESVTSMENAQTGDC